MKKQRLSVLIIITLLFVSFTLGFFLGQSHEESGITVSVPDQFYSQPTEAVATVSIPFETKPEITFPININTAEKDGFMALPGIGEVLAERILDYREMNGDFACTEDLMYVEGIGQKRLEEILDFITVGG